MPASPSIKADTTPTNICELDQDKGSKIPLLFLSIHGAVWFVVASALLFFAAVKMHGPEMAKELPFFTYGRLQPAATNAFLYGFLSQAGMASGIWILARLSQTKVALPAILTFGGVLWNATVLVGTVGILAGYNSGFPWMEMPAGAQAMLFVASVVISVCALLTVAARKERTLYPAAWFFIGAFLTLPWILGTGSWTLLGQTVRGAVQLSVNGWFMNSLTWLWFGFLGLGALFYVIPKTSKTDLYSRSSATFAFWILALLAGWGGVHSGAPLPRWIITISESANLIFLVPIALVIHNLWNSTDGESVSENESSSLSFARFALAALIAYGLLSISFYLRSRNLTLQLSLFNQGLVFMFLFGFVGWASVQTRKLGHPAAPAIPDQLALDPWRCEAGVHLG
jgi:cytochrome c oxidase cbb3-type subunit 1